MTGIVKTDQIQGAGSSTVTIPTGNTLNVADNLTVDTNTLHVDASNNKVGIGTTSPEETLEVVHATAPAIQLNRTNDGGFKSILRQQGNDFEIRGSSGSTKIYTGNADGDSSTARLIIDANGRITMPLQPIAEAYYSAATQDGAYSATTRNYVVCKPGATHVNVGNMYDSSTGRFTVPVAGRYLAMVNGSQYNSGISSYHYVYIRKNGTMQKMIYNSLSSGSSGWTAMSGSTTFDCAANDYIDFENRHDSNNSQRGGWDVGGYTKFFVMLLT